CSSDLVLGDQAAVGQVDLGVGGRVGQAQHAPGILARAAEPVRVEGVADDQADEAAGRVAQQQPAGDEAEDLSVPAIHGAILSPPRRPPHIATMPARRLPPDSMATTLLEANLPGLPLRHRGKVRDVFDLPADSGEPKLLMVATDRL